MSEKYKILEQMQPLVNHFQAISILQVLYILGFGRLEVTVLHNFNYRTIQAYLHSCNISLGTY